MNCLHTGGAHGGDKHFESLAERLGHDIKRYHFDGHKSTRVEVLSHGTSKYEQLEISKNDMQRCSMDLENAALLLGEDLVYTGYQRHLLERDWILVHKSKALFLYAIGHFDEKGQVQGGTGWIIELFKSLNKSIYFHCEETNQNYTWKENTWIKMDKKPLPPYGNWIGVGTRTHEEEE